MLGVTVTVLFASYVLGPNLFSRILLGLIVPRRNVVLTRGEEVSRAILWSVIPLCVAVLWAKWSGSLGRLWIWHDLDTCFSGIYSEKFFLENRAYWFYSTRKVLWLNGILLWRLYTIVGVTSLVFDVIILRYARIRRRMRNHPTFRNLLAAFVVPRIAPWHLLFSRILVERDDLRIHLDVLTKAGIMYQGELADKMMSADGSLVTLTLASPRRFRRERYLDACKSSDSKINIDDFWKPIPTNMFLIMAGEIHTINVRYVPENMAALKSRLENKDLSDALRRLNGMVERLNATIGDPGSDG